MLSTINLCIFEGVATNFDRESEGTSFQVICNGEKIPVYSEEKVSISDGVYLRIFGKVRNDGATYIELKEFEILVI